MRYARVPVVVAMLVAGWRTGAGAAEPPAYAPGDGPMLFARARDAWTAMRYPPLVTYDVAVRVTRASAVRGDRYAGVVRPATADFRVALMGEDEQLHPYVPHGVNVKWQITIGINSGGRGIGETADHASHAIGGPIAAEKSVEPYAIPELSPLYSFGIRACPAVSTTGSDELGGLRRIGSVATMTRRYRILFAGTETVDEQAALHLTLAPLVDPRRDRLRDLWLAPDSFRPVRARVAGNFTGKAESGVPW
ncbi:MAG TPA: hypothetical protein VHT53_00350, partial [Candidatus Elarobacter sp.]|nr:hypothetical protein [Candidatus Elarobacter sp.]